MLSSLAVFLAVVAVGYSQQPQVILATFDGAQGTTYNWKVMNDPVMGGQSVSSWKVNASTAVWDGQVKIVPSLKAPGFCNLETTNGILTHFNDASPYTHLLLRVRSSTPEYKGYKVSFAADSVERQFKSFKANFNITGTDWTTVAIPFDQFSNDWSPYTGDCFTKDPTGLQHYCCSSSHPQVCPTKKNLHDINQLGLWTEGAAGTFHLEVLWIAAGSPQVGAPKKSTQHSRTATLWSGEGDGQDIACCETLSGLEMFSLTAAGIAPTESVTGPHKSTCKQPIQQHLKYNVSGRLAQDYLPLSGFLPLEGLAFAVCCDSEYEAFAEPSSFFALPDVDLFAHMNQTGTTVFYDSACGLPVFVAPVNRTFADFKADTTNHTWPSFRPGEIFLENVVINATSGDISSKCGTHLGSLDPDARGERYCIDLSCISGNKVRG